MEIKSKCGNCKHWVGLGGLTADQGEVRIWQGNTGICREHLSTYVKDKGWVSPPGEKLLDTDWCTSHEKASNHENGNY